MALIINVVDPALEKSYNIQNLLLKDIFNTNAWIITTILIILAIILLVKISAKKRKEAK
jgi:hypothetical protein